VHSFHGTTLGTVAGVTAILAVGLGSCDAVSNVNPWSVVTVLFMQTAALLGIAVAARTS
jgi:hypothetical protein